jgi:hypothetical protein
MQEHFKTLKSRYGIEGMGLDRFSTLLSAFAPSIVELKHITDLLHRAFISHVQEGTV